MKYTKQTTVDYDFEVGEGFSFKEPEFEALLECLKNDYTFVATTCIHYEWPAFPSYSQGGTNMTNLEHIEILAEEFGKLAINVWWMDCDTPTTVLFKKKS